MERQIGHAALFLNDTRVGRVTLRGTDTSWSFGDFEPNDSFGPFAPIFARWSLLMHDDPDKTLHEAASEELREAEIAIDRLHAKLHFKNSDVWQKAVQINIDGPLVEWKHY